MKPGQNIKQPDRRIQQQEHNQMLSSEKMTHKETFWMAVAIVLIFSGLIALTILGRSGPEAAGAHPFPFWPMY